MKSGVAIGPIFSLTDKRTKRKKLCHEGRSVLTKILKPFFFETLYFLLHFSSSSHCHNQI